MPVLVNIDQERTLHTKTQRVSARHVLNTVPEEEEEEKILGGGAGIYP
jgi:hypothetical protein